MSTKIFCDLCKAEIYSSIAHIRFCHIRLDFDDREIVKNACQNCAIDLLNYVEGKG